MKYENDDQKRTIQRWARLAIQLNGAVDTGAHAHLSVPIVIKEIRPATSSACSSGNYRRVSGRSPG